MAPRPTPEEKLAQSAKLKAERQAKWDKENNVSNLNHNDSEGSVLGKQQS
jgi:hypothetical protein